MWCRGKTCTALSPKLKMLVPVSCCKDGKNSVMLTALSLQKRGNRCLAPAKPSYKLYNFKDSFVKRIGFFLFASLITGCSATKPPSILWISSAKVDEFTDTVTCSVSVGSLYTKSSVFTYSHHYYPYIEVVNGDVRVGVRSGGKYPIPVGDVQIRIDSNVAWNISSGETPLDYVPEGTLSQMQEYTKNLPEQNQQLVEATYKTAMETAARAMSPFTAATGEKAQLILKEMLSGEKIKYRTIGLNQAASSTGEYDLGPSLTEALSKCGINL